MMDVETQEFLGNLMQALSIRVLVKAAIIIDKLGRQSRRGETRRPTLRECGG